MQEVIYEPYPLHSLIHIRQLFSLHYFEFAAGYIFEGERHDFWEMVYLDKGEADIGADEKVYTLRQGDIIFHKPHEFHSIWANHATGPNIAIVSFSCASPAMRFFRRQLLHLNAAQRQILHRIIVEGRALFGPMLDNSQLPGLGGVVRADAPLGAEQMIQTSLEQLLITLLRDNTPAAHRHPAPRLNQEDEALRVTQLLQGYMREHLTGELRFEDICRYSGLGATALKELFRRYNGMGPMAYYQHLRMEHARRLLREGRLNITEIAAALGYPSIHGFSRAFKTITGMTPTEYARSVQP